MKKLKEIIENIKKHDFFSLFIIYILQGIYFIYIDFFNQYLVNRKISTAMYENKNLVGFNIIWVLLAFLIIYVLKNRGRKIFLGILNVLLLIFSIVNYFINSYFGSAVSWKDLVMTKNGLTFADSIFKFINGYLIIFIIVAIIFIICILFLKTKHTYKIKSFQTLFIIILGFGLIFGYNNIQKNLTSTNDGWNSNVVLENDSNYYVNWIEPARLIKICGTYEYLIRDFYFSFLKNDNPVKAKEEVKKYLKTYKKTDENKKYNGIFKDKNLIYVMMEAMDDWLISEEVTPTIYKMMQHGFNFKNHYSPSYVTGDTANTEFMANSGLYPSINKLSPNYAYVNNAFPYSIANLFKNEGYVTNSFHRSNGFIYNRDKMHLSFGYKKYHNYADMGIDASNLDLDSYIVENGYKKIVSDDKFMSFIITYSPHSPFTYDKIECKNNLEEIKKVTEETDEEKLCALSAARETDNMFKKLLEELEEDGILEDTVIVAFSDHPNHLLVRDDETDLLNKTIFFVYNSETKKHKINTLSSSINILPTIVNLFDLDNKYVYPGYDVLNTNEEYVFFKDYTYFDGENMKKATNDMIDAVSYSSNLLISDYYKSKK